MDAWSYLTNELFQDIVTRTPARGSGRDGWPYGPTDWGSRLCGLPVQPACRSPHRPAALRGRSAIYSGASPNRSRPWVVQATRDGEAVPLADSLECVWSPRVTSRSRLDHERADVLRESVGSFHWGRDRTCFALSCSRHFDSARQRCHKIGGRSRNWNRECGVDLAHAWQAPIVIHANLAPGASPSHGPHAGHSSDETRVGPSEHIGSRSVTTHTLLRSRASQTAFGPHLFVRGWRHQPELGLEVGIRWSRPRPACCRCSCRRAKLYPADQ